MFPITPADLRDRDLVRQQTACGFRFAAENHDIRTLLVRQELKDRSVKT
jgi:hypothetical protein